MTLTSFTFSPLELEYCIFWFLSASLCLNDEPGKLSFNLSALRQHLIQCLEAGEFTSFPVLDLKRCHGFKIKIQANGYSLLHLQVAEAF